MRLRLCLRSIDLQSAKFLSTTIGKIDEDDTLFVFVASTGKIDENNVKQCIKNPHTSTCPEMPLTFQASAEEFQHDSQTQ